jgi:hypothetical protein
MLFHLFLNDADNIKDVTVRAVIVCGACPATC